MRGEATFLQQKTLHISISQNGLEEKLLKSLINIQVKLYMYNTVCVCVWYLLKNKKESRYLLSTVYSYKKSTVSIASSPQSFVSSA